MTCYLQEYFPCQNPTSRDTQSDQDPDPDGSGTVWLPRSGSAVTPMRILSTTARYRCTKKTDLQTLPIEIEGSVVPKMKCIKQKVQDLVPRKICISQPRPYK